MRKDTDQHNMQAQSVGPLKKKRNRNVLLQTIAERCVMYPSAEKWLSLFKMNVLFEKEVRNICNIVSEVHKLSTKMGTRELLHVSICMRPVTYIPLTLWIRGYYIYRSSNYFFILFVPFVKNIFKRNLPVYFLFFVNSGTSKYERTRQF